MPPLFTPDCTAKMTNSSPKFLNHISLNFLYLGVVFSNLLATCLVELIPMFLLSDSYDADRFFTTQDGLWKVSVVHFMLDLY
jgi:hypothetical protein